MYTEVRSYIIFIASKHFAEIVEIFQLVVVLK